MGNKLYRSQTDKMIAGVCGGLGEYLGIDPTLVRVFFVLLAVMSAGSIGILVYLLLWIVLPYSSEGAPGTTETVRSNADEIAARARSMGEDLRGAMRRSNLQASVVVGGILILLGVMFLFDNLNLWWLRWLDFDTLWPLLLIAAGGVLIWRRVGNRA